MEEQAQRGISLLDRGLKFHPDNYILLRDKAMIYQDRLQDLPDAAENWRLAAATSNSPFFAAREYVELLLQMGERREAYDYLRQLYPTLPPDAPEAQKGVISDWMRALENLLKIPHDNSPQFAPPPGWKPDPNAVYMPELFQEIGK